MRNPVIDNDGSKRWYKGCLLHRDHGPAFERCDGRKVWWVNGKKHRIDGPAFEYEDGRKEYWINNKRYDSLEEGLMDLALR